MFADDFNPAQTLATEVCPRCHAVGLAVPDAQTISNVLATDLYQEKVIVCPSITAWCPACGLLGSWPGMCEEPEVKPKRKHWGHSEIA